VFLYNIKDIIKDISYFSLSKIKYKAINNKLIFNLNLLVFKYKRGVIYKRIKVLKLNYNRFIRPLKRRGTLLKS
jgi:hypothetical protein